MREGGRVYILLEPTFCRLRVGADRFCWWSELLTERLRRKLRSTFCSPVPFWGQHPRSTWLKISTTWSFSLHSSLRQRPVNQITPILAGKIYQNGQGQLQYVCNSLVQLPPGQLTELTIVVLVQPSTPPAASRARRTSRPPPAFVATS